MFLFRLFSRSVAPTPGLTPTGDSLPAAAPSQAAQAVVHAWPGMDPVGSEATAAGGARRWTDARRRWAANAALLLLLLLCWLVPLALGGWASGGAGAAGGGAGLWWPQALASAVCLLALVLAARWWLGLDRRAAAGRAALQASRQHERQQLLFDAQARQLEALRRQAHADALTGLPNRRHFVALVSERLCASGEQAQAGLLLLRLRDLQGVNQRIGHVATDRLILAVAQAIQIYPQRIEHCCAGRLNGSDFALLLPIGGLAAETAASLLAALRLPLSQIDARAQVAIGAVEIDSQQVPSAAQALALADAALAEAESCGGLAVDEGRQPPVLGEASGEGAWQRRISRALALGKVALGEYAVCTPDGRRLHLDCPLRVQLTPGGPFEPAQRWLSLAVRSRLSAQVDEKALALALEAIARDGQARCVNLSAQALGSPEFVAAVTRRLEAAPDATSRLWLDVPESLALDRPMLVREVSRRWRSLGAQLALEHAGEALMRIHRLIDLGLDCVRIDGRFVNGIADPAAEPARRYLAGLVRLVQSVGLQVTAEDVRSVQDLEMLWSMGFDAATGPALEPSVRGVDIELPDPEAPPERVLEEAVSA